MLTVTISWEQSARMAPLRGIALRLATRILLSISFRGASRSRCLSLTFASPHHEQSARLAPLRGGASRSGSRLGTSGSRLGTPSAHVASWAVEGCCRSMSEMLVNTGTVQVLSHTMYYLNGFRKSTPPQKRQLIVLIGNSEQ